MPLMTSKSRLILILTVTEVACAHRAEADVAKKEDSDEGW